MFLEQPHPDTNNLNDIQLHSEILSYHWTDKVYFYCEIERTIHHVGEGYVCRISFLSYTILSTEGMLRCFSFHRDKMFPFISKIVLKRSWKSSKILFQLSGSRSDGKLRALLS